MEYMGNSKDLLCELWLGPLAPLCGAKGSLVVNGHSLLPITVNCTGVDIWGSTLFPPLDECQFILYLASEVWYYLTNVGIQLTKSSVNCNHFIFS
jgi:hypothetical protein